MAGIKIVLDPSQNRRRRVIRARRAGNEPRFATNSFVRQIEITRCSTAGSTELPSELRKKKKGPHDGVTPARRDNVGPDFHPAFCSLHPRMPRRLLISQVY